MSYPLSEYNMFSLRYEFISRKFVRASVCYDKATVFIFHVTVTSRLEKGDFTSVESVECAHDEYEYETKPIFAL